jgi:two-component system OmpR family response regulator
LSPLEYALLEFLAFNHGKVMNRAAIKEHLYDEHDRRPSNIVDVYISYLRRKLDWGLIHR